ncbi:general receptor for phosphoinositides 1-associated scaffold protein isoform X1 [Tachysurus ichikawai]
MKNMTFRRVKDSGDIYFSSSKSDSYKSMDLPSVSSDVYDYKTLTYSGGTLPRNFKKNAGLQKWKPLTLPPEPERKTVLLEKKEDESFGFELQTYGLHHQDENSVELCTFVCKVQEDSPAKLAGLKVVLLPVLFCYPEASCHCVNTGADACQPAVPGKANITNVCYQFSSQQALQQSASGKATSSGLPRKLRKKPDAVARTGLGYSSHTNVILIN